MTVGEADRDIRLAVFDWLTEHREYGEVFSRTELELFTLRGTRVPLVGPQGIWKPAACVLPLSIATVYGGPYSDTFDDQRGLLRYAYRRTHPEHRDNRGLRQAMVDRVPLVYFHGIAPSQYVAAYPVFVVADDRPNLMFDLEVNEAASLAALGDAHRAAEDAEPQRAYVIASFRRRVHQASFRERVLRAYRERCALCRLAHPELLDAAHITPDREETGLPTVTNGLALCKLHHAAFDQFFFTVKPDYVVEVRPSILTETDGPMLVVGLQQIHGNQIHLPTRRADLPDRDRLAARLEQFRQAS